MQLTPIPDSSNVRAVGYDEATQTLRVQFATGIYDYSGVKPEQWQALLQARADGKSVGSWLAIHIVRKHEHRKVEESTSGQ